MRIRFTKMQGAGNDFVVLDETQGRLGLHAAHYRFLADRHFGVGADQILGVRASPAPGIDFEYIIHNADGAEVEQCGNGARCFARFVREHALSGKDVLRVQTKGGVIEPQLHADGGVSVDMGAPVFALADIPFAPGAITPQVTGLWEKWPLELMDTSQAAPVFVAVLSMGNPHAVLLVDDVERAAVATLGPAVQVHPPFRVVSTLASCKLWTQAGSGCVCSSVALARRWPVARAPARRWSLACVSGCSKAPCRYTRAAVI